MSQQKICPWWLGYTFILPFRKYKHNPDVIAGPYIIKGANVLDFGCAMGFFSIPMAKMTGAAGKVYCVDIQQKMLDNLVKRAKKYEVNHIIKPLLADKNYEPISLINTIDFVLLFAVVHEVPDQQKLFNEIALMLKPGGNVMFAEPNGHVKPEEFQKSIKLALDAGLQIDKNEILGKGKLSVLLVKK